MGNWPEIALKVVVELKVEKKSPLFVVVVVVVIRLCLGADVVT